MSSSDPRTKVLCVDDSADIARLCQRIVDAEADMECVGTLDCADALIEKVLQVRADVVLLDLTMPGKDPLMAIRELAVAAPWCRVLGFSGYDDPARLESLLEAGAWGLVSKDSEPKRVATAIRRVAAGEFVQTH